MRCFFLSSLVVLVGAVVTHAQIAAPPAVKLAEVVVTPSRFGVSDSPMTAAASLTAAELEVLPQLGDDLFRSIARLPGLAADDVTAQFWVRGAPQSQLLARLDGVDLIEPFHLKDVDGALSIVDPSVIRRLDLATGGFSVDYGDRLAAVLTMDTKTPTRPLTTLGLSLTGVGGSHQGVFAQNRGRWLLSARRGYPDIALRLSDRSNDISPRYYDVMGKVEYDIAPAHAVSFHVLHAGDALRYVRRSSNNPSLTSAYDSDYAWARWRGSFGERVSGEAVLSFTRLTWERDGSGRMDGFPFALRDRRALEQVALRNEWTATVSDRLVVRGGLEGKTGEARNAYVLNRSYNVVSGGRETAVPDNRQVAFRPEGSAVGGFVAMRVQPFAALVIEPGVRVDYQDWAHPPQTVNPTINVVGAGPALPPRIFPAETEVSPRLNAALSIGRATVRAAWGRYAQATGLHELELAEGERAFGWPERAEHRVLGIEYPLGRHASVRIEAYERLHSRVRPRWENLDNAYDLFPELQSDRVGLNPTEGRARGLEVLLSGQGNQRLQWHVSYVAARAEEKLAGRWVPRSRDQRHAFYADATYVLNPRWQFSAAWQFHTGWPTTDVLYSPASLTNGRRIVVSANGPIYGLRLTDYHRLDLRATRRFKTKRGEVRVYLDIFNAYDRANVLGYDHRVTVSGTQVTDVKEPREQLPFLPSVGVSWEF